MSEKSKFKFDIHLDEEKVLESLFDDNVCEHTFWIIPNKVRLTIRSLTFPEHQTLEDILYKETDKGYKAAQEYLVEKLSLGIKEIFINRADESKSELKAFRTPADCKSWILKQNNNLIDRLVAAQGVFEFELKKLINPETISENFSKGEDSSIKPEQS